MKCKVCGENTFFVHKGTRDRADIDVYECEACHTKQLSIIEEKDYQNGFMNNTKSMTDEEIQKRLNETKSDDLRRVEYIKKIVDKKTILDFGCGFGGFAKYLRDSKDVSPEYISCVELSTDEFIHVNEQGINCTRGIEEQRDDFDFITLFHVFEHLNNPLLWLDKFSKHINDNGRIIIEVPNGNDALLSRYKCDKFADFTYWSAHLYLYTVEGFKKLMEKCDSLEIEKCEQVQRYPLANHLFWLSQGKPGGQKVWSDMSNNSIDAEYQKALAQNNECDTLIFTLKKKKN